LACIAIKLPSALSGTPRFPGKRKRATRLVGRIALLLHLRSRAALGYLLAVVSEPFLGAFFEPFLLFFLVVVSLLLLGVWLLVAGGVAWANIMGIATANTSPKIVFFMASFLPRGLCPLHFHDAAGRPKTR
jgi:hypothetical protein